MDMTPGIVLVRPQMGENIGAAARAMLNFGLDHMRVIAPRDGWPNQAAVAMASGAGRVLDNAMICEDVAGGVADFHYTFATTARSRDLSKPVFSPEAAMKLAAEKIAQGQRVGVIFGPERTGLENDDLMHANAIVTVPVNPDYASLNLAQCVLLLGYEWRRVTQEVVAFEDVTPGTDIASGHDVHHMAQHVEEVLERAGFFFPEDKAPAMKIKLRNMWGRFALTTQDTRMVHGMMRQLVRWKDKM